MVSNHAEVYVPRSTSLTNIDQSFSAPGKGETAVIKRVAEVGLVEVLSMKNHVDQQSTHCPLPRYPMSLMRVNKTTLSSIPHI